MVRKRKVANPQAANVQVVGRSVVVLQAVHGKKVGKGVPYVLSVIKPTGVAPTANAVATKTPTRRRKK